MELVWSAFPGSGSELLAMLVMANWSDDQGGNLFPSIAKVAERIRCSESQARRVLHRLIDGGWLGVIGNSNGGAPGATRRYVLNVEKLVATAGTGATPREDATPRTGARDGSHGREKTAGTGATQYVKKQPSVDVKKKVRQRHELGVDDLIAEGVERQHAEDWLQVRRTKRAPLTATAWDDVKAEAGRAGITAAEAVRVAAARSWQGFKASWLKGVGGTQAHSPRISAVDQVMANIENHGERAAQGSTRRLSVTEQIEQHIRAGQQHDVEPLPAIEGECWHPVHGGAL